MIKFTTVSVLLLSVIGFLGAATFKPDEFDFIEQQNKSFIGFINEYLSAEKSGDYNSLERKSVLYLIDSMTHYPFPHSEPIKNFFTERYLDGVEGFLNTDIREGVGLWNVYNMAFLVKTPEISVAFDLVRLGSRLDDGENREIINATVMKAIKECDILFVSHWHGDHAESFIAKAFIEQGKPVIANETVFENEPFSDKVMRLPRDGKQRQLDISGHKLKVRIYPGHQGETLCNYYFITFPNGITVSHSGDQHNEDDFKWLSNIHSTIDTDILITNTWTLNPQRVCEGIKPKVLIPSHINEMQHTIDHREPYWKSYDLWGHYGDKVVRLIWGETYKYNK